MDFLVYERKRISLIDYVSFSIGIGLSGLFIEIRTVTETELETSIATVFTLQLLLRLIVVTSIIIDIILFAEKCSCFKAK